LRDFSVAASGFRTRKDYTAHLMNELLGSQIQQEIGRVRVQRIQLDEYGGKLTETLHLMQSLKGSSVSVIDRAKTLG
jgi:hypothetical protein